MQITIDNRDLEKVHIDTYQMLTGESAEEYERDYMREEGREDWDTVDITYNHNAIVKAFALESIKYLTQELTTQKPQVVESIKYGSHGSPKFYNYTTDYYVAEYTVNTVELHKYIAENYDAVYEKAKSYRDEMILENGEYESVSKESLAHAGLCHYIDNHINSLSDDDYNYHMWEHEHQIYSENATVVESSN